MKILKGLVIGAAFLGVTSLEVNSMSAIYDSDGNSKLTVPQSNVHDNYML